jgi:hypothetical protein
VIAPVISLIATLPGQLWPVPLASAAARPSPGRAISSDPYRNRDSQHRTQVEPASFAVGSTIVAAFQVGRFFSGGASNIGFATSNDGGRTWRPGFLPRTTVHARPAGRYARASDPSVAYDARHRVWLISYLAVRGSTSTARSDVLVSRSVDGGVAWGVPVAVSATGHFLDKNWTTCDNTPTSRFYGRCYTEFDDVTRKALVLVSTSADGGSRWGAPLAPPGGAHGLGGQPLVRPDGILVVPYVGLDSPYFRTISSFASVNGGTTLTRSTPVSEADPHRPSGGLRASPLPSAQVDRTGRIYVAWADCRFEASCSANDLVLSTSSNGTMWSPARRIPIDPVGSGVDHFIPGLAVDQASSGRSARVGLTYYFYPSANCTIATCRLSVGFVSSTNGGVSWSGRRVVAGPMRLTWLPATSQGRMIGDYIATSISSGRVATAIFALARPLNGKTFDQAIYAGRLRVTGGGHRLGSEAAVAHSRAGNRPFLGPWH